MPKGNWEKTLERLSEEQGEGSASNEGQPQPERHLEIRRTKLMAIMRTNLNPLLTKANDCHVRAGKEIDELIEAVVENSQRDGLDLDGELIERLSLAAGHLHAIQLAMKDIAIQLTNK